MLNLNKFAKVIYILNCLSYFPKLAITQNTKIDIRTNLEDALNNRNLQFIKSNFKRKRKLKNSKNFQNSSKIS